MVSSAWARASAATARTAPIATAIRSPHLVPMTRSHRRNASTGWKSDHLRQGGGGQDRGGSGSGEFAVQPRAGHGPVAFDGHRRDAQQGGGFLDRQAAEEPQLDDAALSGIEGF